MDGSTNEKIDKYLKYIVTYGNIKYPDVFIIVNFLLATVFSHYKLLCVNLHPSSCISLFPCFMVLPPDLLQDTVKNRI